ncbi:MAG: hypothetical protein CMJ83_02410 [Planctomycetes bacterium]|jgi:hypothetical protein|nr:hypothetical protein [Planctomycetota bacterium]
MRLRIDRVWLTLTAVFLFTTLWLLFARTPDKVALTAHLPDDTHWTLARVATLTHPATDEEPEFPERTGSGSPIQVDLLPGHYLITVEHSDHTDTVPVLILPDHGDVTIEILDPPGGFSPVPAGASIDGVRGPVRSLDHGFGAARHEVTRTEYAAFLATPAGAGHGNAKWLELESHPERGSWPVSRVNHADAVAYAAWRTELDGGGQWTFRLPTTLEWDKMARGTDGRTYPWGDRDRRDPLADRTVLRPVDTWRELRSPYGLLHMESNVAEWTADAADPAGVRRIIRGRSTSVAAGALRAVVASPATLRSPDVGFRLVVEPVR